MKINSFENIQIGGKRKINYANCLVEVTDAAGNVAYASDTVAVANALGCTKQLISNCINKPNKYKTAKGCKIRLVDSVTLEPVEG